MDDTIFYQTDSEFDEAVAANLGVISTYNVIKNEAQNIIDNAANIRLLDLGRLQSLGQIQLEYATQLVDKLTEASNVLETVIAQKSA